MTVGGRPPPSHTGGDGLPARSGVGPGRPPSAGPDYCDFNGVEPTDEQLLALSRALIADPDHEGVQFIARGDDGRAIGFATLVWTWATWSGGRIGIMGDLFVAAPARRSGVGRKLIEECRRQCRRVGARGLMWSTAKDNAPGRALYESIGAESREWVDYWLDV
jgi:GNAT superfamily N-acetyltransferase